MINNILIGLGAGATSIGVFYFAGRWSQRWEMNRLINNPDIPEDIKRQARDHLDKYNLENKTSKGKPIFQEQEELISAEKLN